MRPVAPLLALSLVAVACTDETSATPADAAVTDIPASIKDAGPPPPPWPHELPAARVMGEARGWSTRRVIVHSHSVHSHDACDGNPYVDGGPNEPCLQSFRRSVCRARVDVVFLTEHEDLISSVPFERVMQVRAGDEPVMENGAMVGYRIACEGGHRTLVLPGAENELMPLGLTRHPDRVNGDLGMAYHADDAAGVRRFREAGALVAVAHVEQRTIEHLRELSPDVIEVYNVHANIDPRIATTHLGIEIGQGLADMFRFTNATLQLEPDFAFMAFFQENQSDLRKWAMLLTDGRRIPGVAASDSHENAFPLLLRDGERGDSYRRIYRFFSNEILVEGELTRQSVMSALARGRLFVAFETFGTPAGFAYTARTMDGMTHDMGAQVSLRQQPVLTVAAPSVYELSRELPVPSVRVRILKAMADGTWQELANQSGAPGMVTATHTPTTAGAYRVEVRITPEHARPYLPTLERLVREMPWIYSNPIYVTE